MPIDTSIPLRVQPFTIDDPVERYGKMLALKGAQRQFTLEDDISQAAKETGGDPSAMSNALMQRGHFTPAMQLRTQMQQQEQLTQQNRRLDIQDKREARKADWEETDHKLKMVEAGANDSLMLDQLWQQSLQKNGGDPIMAITEVQPAYSQIREKWLGITGGKSQLPEAFDPDANRANIGQAKQFSDQLKEMRKQQDQALSMRAAEFANTKLGVTPRGQNTGGEEDPNRASVEGDPEWHSKRAEFFRSVGRDDMADAAAKQAKDQKEKATELSRLMQERDALPKGSEERKVYDKVIAAYKAGRGDTNVEVHTGPMTPGKAGGTKVDEDMLNVTRNLMQLDTISGQFKPEFQRYQDKIGFKALSVKDSTVGLTNKEKQDLTEYSQYRRNAFNTLNEYIKSITGAAMTNAEADRILKGLPSPGTGLFDGDSPTEFKAKLDDAIKQTKMSVARLAYIKRNGMSLEDGNGNAIIPLERMPALMNERGAQIEKELRKTNNKIDDKALGRAVRRQLSIEFGLSSD